MSDSLKVLKRVIILTFINSVNYLYYSEQMSAHAFRIARCYYSPSHSSLPFEHLHYTRSTGVLKI